MRLAIFIDGGYLDKVLEHDFEKKRLDYEKLSQNIVALIRERGSQRELFRTYYYHCPPYQSTQPTDPEKAKAASRDKFFNALNQLPRYQVRLGRLAKREDKSGSTVFQQKLVDVLLSVDLVELSAKGNIHDAVLVAGDSDFCPAVEAAKRNNVNIWLFHAKKPHNELWSLADERILLTRDFIQKCERVIQY